MAVRGEEVGSLDLPFYVSETAACELDGDVPFRGDSHQWVAEKDLGIGADGGEVGGCEVGETLPEVVECAGGPRSEGLSE